MTEAIIGAKAILARRPKESRVAYARTQNTKTAIFGTSVGTHILIQQRHSIFTARGKLRLAVICEEKAANETCPLLLAFATTAHTATAVSRATLAAHGSCIRDNALNQSNGNKY